MQHSASQDVNDRQNRSARNLVCASQLSFVSAVVGTIFQLPLVVCAGSAVALVTGAMALYLAASAFRIIRVAIPLLLIGLAINLCLPEAIEPWHVGLGQNILLNFSLLCVTGAVVALLRNSFGSGKWIEEHDFWSALTLAFFLVVSALYKTYKTSWHATEFADLSLVLAGVVVGAMFEKERAKRRHAKKAASTKSKSR